MPKKLYIIIFSLIFFAGVFLRFYKLGNIPNSLDWDEVSQAYNAYSILTTGKDEFGTAYPLTIRSFNDHKPPSYTYLTIAPVGIFGLNPFSARFPSAFCGSLSILLVYALAYEIFRKEKYVKTVSLLSMLFFSISPLSIQFSRTGFDANIGVFLVTLGTWLFIKGLNKKKIGNIFLGAFFLAISVYSAHSEKVFVPLFFICLIFYGRKFFLKKKAMAICIITLFAFLNLFWFFDSQTRTRSSGVLFTSSQGLLKNSVKEMAFDKSHDDFIGTLVHNRRFVYVNKYIENYLSHFDPNSLFVTGDNARHHAPGMGILYLVSLPFILLGMLFVVRRKIYPAYLFFAWIFIAPVASSFAINSPNFQRSLIFLPTLHVFEALGWFCLFSYLRKLRFAKIFMGIVIALFLANIFYYLHQYFIFTNFTYGKYWQYGYEQAINYVKKYENTDREFFFANNIEQGYIFYLFYSQYDPQKYIENGGSNRINADCYSISNVCFGVCSPEEGDFYVSSKEPSPSEFKIIDKILYPDNETAVWIVQRI